MDQTLQQALPSIISGVLQIIERHRASGATTPLTDVEVHAQLLADLQDGQSAIAQEFASKGWPLPV